MPEHRWYNPRLPQTLVIAQFLLYFNAFFAGLAVLAVGFNSSVQFSTLGKILSFGALFGFIYGAYGIANERKRGYQVAVAVAFMPLAIRFIDAVRAPGGLFNHLGYVLFAGDIISVMFQYALIGLLLHQQSREHQRIWFS